MSLIEQYRDSGELPDDPAILMQLHQEMQANEANDEQVAKDNQHLTSNLDTVVDLKNYLYLGNK